MLIWIFYGSFGVDDETRDLIVLGLMGLVNIKKGFKNIMKSMSFQKC